MNPKDNHLQKSARFIRWILFGGTFFLVTVLVSHPKIQNQVGQWALRKGSTSLGIPLTARRVSLGFPNRIVFDDVCVPDANGKSVLTLGSLTVVGPWYSPSTGIRVARLLMDSVTVVLERGPQDSLFSIHRQLAPLFAESEEAPTAWRLGEFRLTHCTAIVQDAKHPHWPTRVVLSTAKVFRMGQEADGSMDFLVREFHLSVPNQGVVATAKMHIQRMADGDIQVDKVQFTSSLGSYSGSFAKDDKAYSAEFQSASIDLSSVYKSIYKNVSWPEGLPKTGVISASGQTRIENRGSSTYRISWSKIKAMVPGMILRSSGYYQPSSSHFFTGGTSAKVGWEECLAWLQRPVPPFLTENKQTLGQMHLFLKGQSSKKGGYASGKCKNVHGVSFITNLRWWGELSDSTVQHEGSFGLHFPEVSGMGLLGSAQWKGKGTARSTLDVSVEADFPVVTVEKQNYGRLTFTGNAYGSQAKGVLKMNHQAMIAQWAGDLHYADDSLSTKGLLSFEKGNFKEMGFSGFPEGHLSGGLEMEYSRWAHGQAALLRLVEGRWLRPRETYPLGNIRIRFEESKEKKSLEVDAYALHAKATGVFDWGELGDWFRTEKGLIRWHEIATSQPTFWTGPQSLSIDLEVKKAAPWLAMLDSGFAIAPGTSFALEYHRERKVATLLAHSPQVVANQWALNNAHIEARWSQNAWATHCAFDSLLQEKNPTIGGFSLRWDGNGHRGKSALEINSGRNSMWAIQQKMEMDLSPDQWIVQWDEGYIALPQDTLRTETGHNRVQWDVLRNRWELAGISWKGKRGRGWIQGNISSDNSEIVRVGVENLDLSSFNPWLRTSSTELAGVLEGNVAIMNTLQSPSFFAQIRVDSLQWNREWLGDVDVSVDYLLDKGWSALRLDVLRGQRKTLTLLGTHNPENKESPLAAEVVLDRFRIMPFQPYVEGVLEQLRGTLRGTLQLSGTLLQPKWSGTIEIPGLAATLPLLGTDYSADGIPKINLTPGVWTLERTNIRDTREKTKGHLTGVFLPKNWNNAHLDLTLTAEDLLALDTETGDDFYGKVYAKGLVFVKGPLDALAVSVDAEPAKQSVLKIPFSGPTEYAVNPVVSFVPPQTGKETVEMPEMRVQGGLDLSMGIRVNPLLTVDLVLDETVGDIIKARGEGFIRVNYPPNGNLSMNGVLSLTGGDYLFTLQNVINKKFDVEPGGTIVWTGDPYTGELTMRALYTTRTTLEGWVTHGDYAGQRVPVRLGMDLTGPLMQPEVAFSISLPQSNPAWQEEIQNRFSDADKRNIQAFSLLLTNSFWREQEGIVAQSVGSVGANTSQVLVSQFSNFLNQGLGSVVDIDVGYTGTTRADLRDQVEVALSKSFFNDRVSVQTQFDVPVGKSSAASQSVSTVAGDVQVEYKITPDGRWKAKAFNKSNNNNPTWDRLSPYTQGVGVEFSKQANSWRELFTAKKKSK